MCLFVFDPMKSFYKRFPLVVFAILGGWTNIIMVCILYKFLCVFKKETRKKIRKALKFYCYHLMISYSGLLFKKPFYFAGNVKKFKSRKNISIFNHCCDFDWIFIIIIYYNLGMYENLFFLMKQELGKIPLLGYLIRQQGHMLLHRKDREKDLSEIEKKILIYNKETEDFSIFLFPEGTYPYKEMYAKCKKYAEENDLKTAKGDFRPNNTLVPRKTGFNAVKQNLETRCIYNGTFLNNPYYFMFHNHQSFCEYFFHEKFPISPIVLMNVQENNNLTENFIYDCFQEKDLVIEKYKELIEKDKKKILNKEEIENILRKLKLIKNDESVDVLEVKSKYRYGIFIITTICQYATYRMIKKLILLAINLFKRNK